MPKGENCPFLPDPFPCKMETCYGCKIRIEAITRENEQIAENMKDYWKCQNSYGGI